MILKKLHFPIFILLTIFFTLESCKEKVENKLKKKDNLVIVDNLLTLGDNHFTNVTYDSAYYYYNKAKSICDVKKDHTRILYSLSRMSEIQQNQGDYAGSEATATEALSFLTKDTDPAYECSIYNLLGIVNRKLFDYDNALYYYNKGLNLKIDETRKLKFKNNIAVAHMSKQDYNQAIKILLPLILKKEVTSSTEPFSEPLENLGYSYFKIGNANGIEYINQSLKIKKEVNDELGMATSYLHLSEYYSKSNPTLAYNYALLAYNKATKINSVDDRLESLALLTQNSAEKQSKYYSQKYVRINDSIKKVRQEAKNQFAKIKYDSKKEKEENIRLKVQKAETALELEQQKNNNLLLIFLVTTGILSTIFLYFYLKAVNKKEKLKASYNTETRIAKKLHDELANDVFYTMTFAETQDLQNPIKKETLLNHLDKIYHQTRNISKENNPIETGESFEYNLKQMLNSYKTNRLEVIIKNGNPIDWSKIDAEKKIAIQRVLQELMINMKKYSQANFVVIGFDSQQNQLIIDYSDNGIGFSEQLILKNGLQNAENRIHAVNGLLTFDTQTNKGFKAKIALPK